MNASIENKMLFGQVEEPFTLILVALAAFIAQLSYLLIGIHHIELHSIWSSPDLPVNAG